MKKRELSEIDIKSKLIRLGTLYEKENYSNLILAQEKARENTEMNLNYYLPLLELKEKRTHQKRMRKRRKLLIKQLALFGATSLTLLILALSIKLGELMGFIELYTGWAINGLSPLDTWLIIILFVFTPPVLLSYNLLLKYKIIEF